MGRSAFYQAGELTVWINPGHGSAPCPTGNCRAHILRAALSSMREMSSTGGTQSLKRESPAAILVFAMVPEHEDRDTPFGVGGRVLEKNLCGFG